MTVNWETGTLRRLDGVLAELRAVDQNPVPYVRQFPAKGRERKAYLSLRHVRQIAELSPACIKPFVWTSSFTAMRENEILRLTSKNVDLAAGLIHLSPEETKEGAWNRLPIRKELVLVLEAAMKVSSSGTDRVFLIRDKNGARSSSKDSTKNPWHKAGKALGLDDPRPRFHDVRHTWRANAGRSKGDWVITECSEFAACRHHRSTLDPQDVSTFQ